MKQMKFLNSLAIICLPAAVLFLHGCASSPSVSSPTALPLRSSMQNATVMPVFTPFTHAQTIEHIVGPQETLWRISKTYDVDMNTIMQVNGLRDPKALKNGQKLRIPNTMGPRPVIPLYPSNKWQYIVIHHTATHDGNAHSIDQIHQQRGFWNGLGYHFLIDNGTGGKIPGQIEVGPRWVKQQNGAHANAANMNEMGIGIALVGNFSERPMNQKQLNSLIFLVQTLQKYYKIPSNRVIRHGDVPGKNTECPGLKFPWNQFKGNL